ncbi:PilN domain-containing protein [Pseudoneobacillus sp. C159]
MLVDINLLPKKERKNISPILILAILTSIMILGSIFLFINGNSLKKQGNLLEEKILQANQKLQIEQEKRLTTAEETTSVEQLKNAVSWAETYPIKAVPVLKHLTSLLPERGFIQNYSYSGTGNVQLTVQFDTSREAAQFLQWLNQSEWISEATISRLSLATDISNLKDGVHNNYLPRYIGDFQLTLAKDKIKELTYIEKGGDSE